MIFTNFFKINATDKNVLWKSAHLGQPAHLSFLANSQFLPGSNFKKWHESIKQIEAFRKKSGLNL